MDFSKLTPDSDPSSTPDSPDTPHAHHTPHTPHTHHTPEIQAKLDELPVSLSPQSLDRRVVDTVNISVQHQDFARQEAENFDILDTNSVMMFAFKVQQEYTDSLKLLLGDAKIRDLGVGAEIVEKIRNGLKIAEVDKMKKELNPSGLRKSFLTLPGMNKLVSAFSNWESKKIKLQKLVQGVEETIQEQMDALIKENARLDILLQEVRNNFYQLGIYLYAGELIVERGANEYKALREKTVETGDALLVSDLMVMKGQLQAFDSRLLEIKKAYVSAPVEMQNILMTQQAARIEMQTQMNSLLFTVPKLIKSLIRLVSLFNIKNAQDVREQHRVLNAELDELAGNTLEDVSTNAQQALIDAAEEANRIEVQAEETIALAVKLSDGAREIKTAQEKADATLARVMNDFQKALTTNNGKSL